MAVVRAFNQAGLTRSRTVRTARGLAAAPRAYVTAYEAGLSPYPESCASPTLGDLTDILGVVPGAGLVTSAANMTGILGTVDQDINNVIGGFTGATNDQRRQARVNWVVAAAQHGSTLAAEMIIAAPGQVSGNERAMWQQALSKVPATVLQQAYAASPTGWWPVGDHSFDADNNNWQNPQGPVRAAITQQVQQAAQPAAKIATAASGVANTVASNPLLLVLGGVALFAFLRKR